jgi:S1-C subfamily serine protease
MRVDDLAEKGVPAVRRERAIRRAPVKGRRLWGWLLLVVLALPARAQEDVLGQMDRQVAAIVERVKPSVVSVRTGKRSSLPAPETVKPKSGKSVREPMDLFKPSAWGLGVFPVKHTGDRAAALLLGGALADDSAIRIQLGPDRVTPLLPARVGTGFVVDRSGVILTTADVVGWSDQCVVRLADGRELDGKVLGRDAATGVAVVQVESRDLPALKMASEARIGPGQWTIIVGNQLDQPHSVWVGSVARDDVALAGPVQGKLLQIHAPVGAGASGAPVLNSRGEVVGIVIATAQSALRFGMGADPGWEKAMTALRDALGKGNPEWQQHVQKMVEEATKKAQAAMERARALQEEHRKKSQMLREEHEKKARAIQEEHEKRLRDLKEDPNGLEEEQKRFETEKERLEAEKEHLDADQDRLNEELERIGEQVEREVEAITERFDDAIDDAIEKSLRDSGFEAAVEEQSERIAAEIEALTQQGAPAQEIELAVQKALQDANLQEQLRRVEEEVRRLSEDAAVKARALHQERQKEIERARKRGRAGEAERRRLEQALRQDEARLQRELRQRQQALERELKRLSQALPSAPGVRSITIDFAPELARIAPPAREMVRAAIATAFAPPLIGLPVPPVLPQPGAVPVPPGPVALPAPGGSGASATASPSPQLMPAGAAMAMAAPEVRFWSGRSAGDAGVTYAVPIERVRWALDQIREHGRVRHAYLGVRLETVSPGDRERLKAPEAARVRVTEVSKGSPAEDAGLRVDDLVLEFNGRKLSDAGDLMDQMARTRVDERVSLSIWREGERRTVPVTLRERPQPEGRLPAWGLSPDSRVAPFIFAPRGEGANTLRSYVRVGPSGHVAASAAGTGRTAKITLDARDAELETVLRELSRATGLQFRAGPAVAKRRVTLKVENVSVDDLVESLSRLYGLRAERNGDRITFRAR